MWIGGLFQNGPCMAFFFASLSLCNHFSGVFPHSLQDSVHSLCQGGMHFCTICILLFPSLLIFFPEVVSCQHAFCLVALKTMSGCN